MSHPDPVRTRTNTKLGPVQSAPIPDLVQDKVVSAKPQILVALLYRLCYQSVRVRRPSRVSAEYHRRHYVRNDEK